MDKKLTMEELVTYLRHQGFVYQGSEIYGGLANAWDYGPVGGTTTAQDSVFGTVQSITLADDAQHSITLPASEKYVEYDDILLSIYAPSTRMDIVAGPYWPYSFGSLSLGWNVIRIRSEVFTTEYPVNSVGLLLYGAGEWKFGSIIGFTNEEGAAELVKTINGLTYTQHSEAEEQAIAAAREAYDALGSVSKTLVTNYSKLTDLEELVEAYHVTKVIEAIDEATITNNIALFPLTTEYFDVVNTCLSKKLFSEVYFATM